MTLAESSKRQYTAVAGRLLRRFQRATGQPPDASSAFVAWLAAEATTVSPATWRLYRAAARYWLISTGQAGAASHLDAAAVTTRPRARSGTAQARTSARKTRYLGDTEQAAIDQALARRPGLYAEALRRWLTVGVLTGLRPVEWRYATLDDTATPALLRVRNAKASQGRAHGEFRTLVLSGLTEAQLALVRDHLATVAHHGQDDTQWAAFYWGVTALLRRVTRRLWPGRTSRPTLYSARHQFIADAKASGLSLEEIAALAGHAVTHTAMSAYGRKRRGRRQAGGFRVRAAPDEIARIRTNHRTHTQGAKAGPGIELGKQ